MMHQRKSRTRSYSVSKSVFGFYSATVSTGVLSIRSFTYCACYPAILWLTDTLLRPARGVA